jgi:hypothetical protein
MRTSVSYTDGGSGLDLARLSLSPLSLWLKATDHGSEPDRTAHSSDGGYPTEYRSDVIGTADAPAELAGRT